MLLLLIRVRISFEEFIHVYSLGENLPTSSHVKYRLMSRYSDMLWSEVLFSNEWTTLFSENPLSGRW